MAINKSLYVKELPSIYFKVMKTKGTEYQIGTILKCKVFERLLSVSEGGNLVTIKQMYFWYKVDEHRNIVQTLEDKQINEMIINGTLEPYDLSPEEERKMRNFERMFNTEINETQGIYKHEETNNPVEKPFKAMISVTL